MLFGDVGFRSVHSFHVFAQRARVGVPLRTARDFTDIRFLEKSNSERKNSMNKIVNSKENPVMHLKDQG